MTFPNSITSTLMNNLARIENLTMLDNGTPTGVPAIFARPLRHTDPYVCIGVVATEWVPDELEIGGTEPTLSTYTIHIQAFAKHTDEQVGSLTHSLLTKSVRAMLYRDPALRVALGSLNESSLGITERAQRWGVRQQRYASNEIDGQFVFLSTTDFWLQTESV